MARWDAILPLWIISKYLRILWLALSRELKCLPFRINALKKKTQYLEDLYFCSPSRASTTLVMPRNNVDFLGVFSLNGSFLRFSYRESPRQLLYRTPGIPRWYGGYQVGHPHRDRIHRFLNAKEMWARFANDTAFNAFGGYIFLGSENWHPIMRSHVQFMWKGRRFFAAETWNKSSTEPLHEICVALGPTSYGIHGILSTGCP